MGGRQLDQTTYVYEFPNLVVGPLGGVLVDVNCRLLELTVGHTLTRCSNSRHEVRLGHLPSK